MYIYHLECSSFGGAIYLMLLIWTVNITYIFVMFYAFSLMDSE